MGDYAPPQTPQQMVRTLLKMVSDDTHRLSINEQAAIAWALKRLQKKT